MASKSLFCFAMVLFMLLTSRTGRAQGKDRQHKIDSLETAINNGKGGLPALRRYINILGYSNDTVTEKFDSWMKKFPKSYAIPQALGEAYYQAKDRKCTQYFMKAWQAGDTSRRMGQMFSVAMNENWKLDVPRTANTLDSLKTVIENSPDSLLPLQQYIFVLGSTNDTVVSQLTAWMEKFPKSATIPFALGENFYNAESPRAKPYLLKVVELQPQNAKVYEMLSIDAERWGDYDLGREYMGKAAAADPKEASYAFYYADAFQEVDSVLWRKKIWELTKNFPDNDRGAQGLYWLGSRSKDKKEKMDVWEQLGKLYPPAKFGWSESGMSSLFDLYLQEGITDKAIALATSMGNSDGFPEKLELAKTITEVRSLVKQKKYAEAREKVAHISLPRYSDAMNAVALLKAEVRDAAGSPQMAYDSLLLIQASTPDEDIRSAIVLYGTKLGRSPEQMEKDIRAIRDKFTKPAPPFELGLYTSNGKAKLEDYRGKVILLTFWFPGCGPCRGEMPHFQNVVNKYNKKDLAYLGINVLPEQDDYVLSFMKGTKFSFVPLRGNGKWAEEVYHVRGEPTNFLIDKEGKIVYSGFMINGNNEHMLELMINSMLTVTGKAQTMNRQAVLDSLKEAIDNHQDNLPALRQYISILGYTNDTVTTQFNAWMRQFPKAYNIPFALGEAYYKAKDKKSSDYFMKAYSAGDTIRQFFRMWGIAMDDRFEWDVPRTANAVDSLKAVVESHPDSLLPVQQYVFMLGNNDDTAVRQIDAWMKQFPNSAAFPFVLGESYYDEESPKAKPFLLRVTELQPQNAKVYYMLYIDAERWGNDDMARTYLGKAAAAEPGNADYAFSYANSFLKTDTAAWRKKLWELTKNFPHDDKGAMGLYWMAYQSPDKNEKMSVLEQLRKLYSPTQYDRSENGMHLLYDLYLQQGLTDKAIELAAAMGDKEGFPEKLELAKNIAVVRSLIKEKKYTEAQTKAAHIKAPRYSDAATAIALLKAEVRDAAGSLQMAYDSLLLIQSKTPDDDIKEAITRYGVKLGKDAEQTEQEIWAIRDKTSRPAPPFDLGLYTSNASAKLEDYRGKVILLTFWFPGCGPCRGEMPHFEHVLNKFDKKDLAFLGINVSPEQDDYVLPFLRGTKFSFTPLRGNGKWAKEVYHVRGEPTNFLIDREGRIVYSDFMIDANNERMLELMINSMLVKKG